MGMKNNYRQLKKILILGIFLVGIFSCGEQQTESFKFVYMTDINLQPEKAAVRGFEKAITRTNQINPDFVLTGGDLIMDALGQTESRADSL